MLKNSNDKKRPTKISRYFEITPSEKSICRIFSTLNIQLTTTYCAEEQRTAYTVFLQNYDKLNINAAEVNHVSDEQHGDLLAFHEMLKYLVYHPLLTKKLNNYEFIIYTNSKHIVTVINENATAKDQDQLTHDIIALCDCIKNKSVLLEESS